MTSAERKKLLLSINEGDYILCINERECKWRIYRANDSGKTSLSIDRECVFVDPDYESPNEDSARLPTFHYREESSRYEFNVDSVRVWNIAAVFRTEADYAHIVEQLTLAEAAFVEATQPFRDRFAVLARLTLA